MFSIRPLSQQDPQWKEKKLGSSNEITIGQYGCLLTSMTMVANGLGYDETPASFNDKMLANGGFAGGLVRPAHTGAVFPGMRFQRRIQCNNPPAPLAEIDAVLATGLPVIVKVDSLPATGMQDHWIVIYAREGDDYLIQDTWRYPAETKRVTLTSRYGFAGTPAEIIKDILIYSGTPSAGSSVSLPAQPVERKARTLPENPLVVYVSADSLALRRQPAILDGNIIRRLPLNTKLLVLEPAQEASARVGQMNVWLEVQVEGRSEQGFVAAWYISTSAQPPPPEAPAGTPTANSGTVSPLHILYVTADGLLLRRQPVIASNNVLRRLPANTQLIALDAPAQVNAKVGVNDQWLKVREVSGFEGYVAAQFVSHKRQEPPLGVSPAMPGQPAPPAPDADRLVLRTTEDRVALRSQPVITSATLLKRLAFQAELLVIEPIAEAAGKVGRANQWILVRDISGAEGYVAAWYLVKSPVPASS
ncbi:MAG: hypothetical protein ROW52_04685 [Anaerolineaceae bacterium]|jgi:hypothetical protein